jgi:hypothetical protein
MMAKTIEFEKAFKYPFNRPAGMINILWLFLPIFGWFALGGYTIRLVQHWSRGDFKELPVFEFGGNLKLGFFMFLKGIPFYIVYMILNSILGRGVFGAVATMFIALFVIPILTINFFNKETVASYFEIDKVGAVFQNIGDYIIAFLKSMLLQIIFFVMKFLLIK